MWKAQSLYLTKFTKNDAHYEEFFFKSYYAYLSYYLNGKYSVDHYFPKDLEIHQWIISDGRQSLYSSSYLGVWYMECKTKVVLFVHPFQLQRM